MSFSLPHRYATLGATREIVRWQRWQVLAERLKSHCGCSPSYQGGEPQSSSSGSSQGYYYPAQPPSALAGAGGLGGLGALSNMHAARTYALQPGATITRRFFANHPTVLQVRSRAIAVWIVGERSCSRMAQTMLKACPDLWLCAHVHLAGRVHCVCAWRRAACPCGVWAGPDQQVSGL